MNESVRKIYRKQYSQAVRGHRVTWNMCHPLRCKVCGASWMTWVGLTNCRRRHRR